MFDFQEFGKLSDQVILESGSTFIHLYNGIFDSDIGG